MVAFLALGQTYDFVSSDEVTLKHMGEIGSTGSKPQQTRLNIVYNNWNVQ